MWNLIAGLGIFLFPVVFSLTVQRFWGAVFVSAVTLTFLVHCASYLGAGYLDPFFMISIPVSILAFLVWSAAVIWVVRHRKGLQRK